MGDLPPRCYCGHTLLGRGHPWRDQPCRVRGCRCARWHLDPRTLIN